MRKAQPTDEFYRRIYHDILDQQEVRRKRAQEIFTSIGKTIVLLMGIGIVFTVLFLTR